MCNPCGENSTRRQACRAVGKVTSDGGSIPPTSTIHESPGCPGLSSCARLEKSQPIATGHGELVVFGVPSQHARPSMGGKRVDFQGMALQVIGMESFLVDPEKRFFRKLQVQNSMRGFVFEHEPALRKGPCPKVSAVRPAHAGPCGFGGAPGPWTGILLAQVRETWRQQRMPVALPNRQLGFFQGRPPPQTNGCLAFQDNQPFPAGIRALL